MKASLNSISVILAAGFAGLALAKLGNASFLSTFRGDIAAAVALSAAVVGFAVYDYSRRMQLLRTSQPVLHPSLPGAGRHEPATRIIRRENALVERVVA